MAYELFYFLSEFPTLQIDPIDVLTQDQKNEVSSFIEGVRSIPECARGWTTVISLSAENMRHPAWEPVRAQARRLVEALAPIMAMRDDYYERTAT